MSYQGDERSPVLGRLAPSRQGSRMTFPSRSARPGLRPRSAEQNGRRIHGNPRNYLREVRSFGEPIAPDRGSGMVVTSNPRPLVIDAFPWQSGAVSADYAPSTLRPSAWR